MKQYITKMRRVQAREITEQTEMVDCYNGMKVGIKGDYIVTDEYGKTMLMKRDKFNNKFIEERNEHGKDFTPSKWFSSDGSTRDRGFAQRASVIAEGSKAHG